MNPENNTQMNEPVAINPEARTPHPVNQITTVSKYLAMVLFVLLPFVGGYVGYRMAPEQIKTIDVYDEWNLPRTYPSNYGVSDKNESVIIFNDLKKLSVGSEIGGLRFLGFTKNHLGTEIANFEGKFEVQGYITSTASDIFFFVTDVNSDQATLFRRFNGSSQSLNPLLVEGLDVHPEYKNINYDDGSRSATTTLLVSGLKIYSPETSSWYHETKFISHKTKMTEKTIRPYECTSSENSYPHTCFSFDLKTTPVIENLTLEAKKQGVISGRTALQFRAYTTENANKIYFTTAIPETDACCGLVSFDTETLKFAKVESYQGLVKSFFSKDKRYFASIEDNATIIVVDLETEKISNRQIVKTGNLICTNEGMFGTGYNVKWYEEKQGFFYDVYSVEAELGGQCKQVPINDAFISVK